MYINHGKRCVIMTMQNVASACVIMTMQNVALACSTQIVVVIASRTLTDKPLNTQIKLSVFGMTCRAPHWFGLGAQVNYRRMMV